MKLNFFFLVILLSSVLVGCNYAHPSNSIPDADRLPQKIIDVTGLTFLNEYEIDNRINPFYLHLDYNNDRQNEYLIFLKKKKSGTHYFLLINNGIAEVKDVREFTGVDMSLAYGKEVNHFPSGSSLPKNSAGFVLVFENDVTRWIYHNNKKWMSINPS